MLSVTFQVFINALAVGQGFLKGHEVPADKNSQ